MKSSPAGETPESPVTVIVDVRLSVTRSSVPAVTATFASVRSTPAGMYTRLPPDTFSSSGNARTPAPSTVSDVSSASCTFATPAGRTVDAGSTTPLRPEKRNVPGTAAPANAGLKTIGPRSPANSATAPAPTSSAETAEATVNVPYPAFATTERTLFV